MQARYIRPEEACKILQVTQTSLRSWSNEGKLQCVRTKGGHRRYEYNSVLGLSKEREEECEGGTEEGGERVEEKLESKPERQKICYARVSSSTQKKDLDVQLEFFRCRYPNHRYIKDLGSGLNFKRRGFLLLLDLILKGDVEELVITHKDRLCRFGYELIERIVQKHNGRIVVLNSEKASPEQELVRDLLTITTVFSARLYGLRSHSLKRQIRGSAQKGKEEKEKRGI